MIFGVKSKNSSSNPKGVLLVLFSESFIILYFTFKFIIHYKLICLTFKVKEVEDMVGM